MHEKKLIIFTKENVLMCRKIAVLVTFVFILTSVLQFNVYAALSNDKQQSIITYNDYNVNYKDA